MLDDLFEDTDLKNAFIQDITACVSMTDGRNIFGESAKLVDDNDDEKLNTLFFLEQIMVRLGFIAHAAIPEPSNEPDGFSRLYSICDITLVIAFVYIGLVDKKVLVLPPPPRKQSVSTSFSAKRSKAIDETAAKLTSLRQVAQNKIASSLEIRTLISRIEVKLIQDHLAFLRNMRKSAKKDDGMFVQKYATARHNVFQVCLFSLLCLLMKTSDGWYIYSYRRGW